MPYRPAFALPLVLVLASAAFAGRFNEVLSIGDKGPVFAGIVGVDDKQHGLADYQEAKLVVLVFTCNHCPVAQAYEDRIIALQKDYQKQGVQVVAVNVNNNPADKLDQMKERATSKKFNFPYLYDASQKSARSYGAATTPHVFVLDGDRNVAYMGAIDDSIAADGVEKPYLRNAVEALLAGKQPPVKETRQVGCGIQYER
jgi:peroxiredoxin